MFSLLAKLLLLSALSFYSPEFNERREVKQINQPNLIGTKCVVNKKVRPPTYCIDGRQ